MLVGGGMTCVPSECLGRLKARLCFPRLVALAVVGVLCGTLMLKEIHPYANKPRWVEVNKCSPRINIAFLKTHKCASSALQNMLFRYGDKHNLTFALPDSGNYFGRGLLFQADMVQSSPLNKMMPNIFAIHTRWNHTEVKKVMPADTVFFTIVREPTATFASLYAYASFEEQYGLTIDQFVRERPFDTDRLHGHLGYNQMAYDFGMSLRNMTNLTTVLELVRQADEQFGLVMIADRMEESLVLLANYLCWDLVDVLVIKFNSLRNEYKIPVSEETGQVLRQKLAPDYLLYTHFLARFDQKVEAFGRERMAASVVRLRELTALLTDACGFVTKEFNQIPRAHRASSKKIEDLAGVGGKTCSMYNRVEINYIKTLRKRQQKRLKEKFGSQPEPPLKAVPSRTNKNKTLSKGNIEKLMQVLGYKEKPEKGEGKNMIPVENEVGDQSPAGNGKGLPPGPPLPLRMDKTQQSAKKKQNKLKQVLRYKDTPEKNKGKNVTRINSGSGDLLPGGKGKSR